VPRITVDLTDNEHERFVNAKMRRKLRSLQALMISSTELALDQEALAESGMPEDNQVNGKTSASLPEKSAERGLHSASAAHTGAQLLKNPGDLQWVEKLAYILNHADRDTQEAIQKNLATFEKYVKLQETAHGSTAEASGEVPGNHKGGVERVRQIVAGSRGSRVHPRGDESRPGRKKKDDSGKTGTGSGH
jgi:hypothetical protein